ncbi:hypothetical protein IQ268_17080 [Oculatella sp. LEGE 06141]|uniref:hypothetical protein n=1 Tax=Oculatella sp. LEGE 06141 TaxID=1828648 RepID=UPI001880B4E7|nr:hypothetical protein [Oculatella sp. LEGE 06141]MBE9180277.1 hypothetical protein [Oculatella sp. LEGE 06141]
MPDRTLPDWLTGVWRRLSIETDGSKDTTTQVIWLQTHQCFGDIRIPADRPTNDRSSLADLTAFDAIALSDQQGFAGMTELQESTCQWHRFIDYQPVTGQRDIGTLAWEGDLLIEEGVDADYREEWQRIDDGGGEFTALVVPATASTESGSRPSWQGCLVTAGDRFIYMWNRSQPLPAADSLTALIDSSTPSSEFLAYLDCEISLGVCQSGLVPWEIQLSTMPWREGQSLWSRSDLVIELDQGYIHQRIQNLEGNRTRQWHIHEWGTGLAFAEA